jgi:O-acetyl-ADP-ribose deacetylase (regulator of RNase III)
MGKGIALQFRQAFPRNYEVYRRACERSEVQPGKMLVVSTDRLDNPRYVVNFPTKRHWKGKSRIEDIESGLEALLAEIRRLNIRSIAIPPLGCGNGGLDWEVVRPMIVRAVAAVPEVQVLLYQPRGAPAPEEMPVATARPSMTPSRAALLSLMVDYGIPGYRLTLLEVQKLAYFLQVAGQPLRLQFVRHKYGPYAETLNHVLQRIEGHFIRGYGDRSRESSIRVIPEAVEEATRFLSGDAETAGRLERVRRLIEGFETPYGMELLATVHWVAHSESAARNDAEEAVRLVQEWSVRKRRTFRPQHIRTAWGQLHAHRWI